MCVWHRVRKFVDYILTEVLTPALLNCCSHSPSVKSSLLLIVGKVVPEK